uniref:Uncharacterized protein n=1 Tax=Anguilla anguilla TaxID=7936 RepID=A0A0E9XMP7_ANGAN
MESSLMPCSFTSWLKSVIRVGRSSMARPKSLNVMVLLSPCLSLDMATMAYSS